MRRVIVVLLAVLVIASCAWSQDLVRNSDFSAAVENQPGKADAWLLPGEAWQRVPDAGPEGSAILRCTASPGVVEPAHQWLAYARPGADHTLTLVARSGGALQPMARLIDRETGDEVASVTVDAGETWREVTVEFNTPTANLGVQLYADARHADGQAGPAGTAEFARVQVSPVGEKRNPVGPNAENLALGQPYEIPRGSYGLCTDPGDATQLTDGEFTDGYFWTQDSTVGWKSKGPKFITIDLGENYPIAGAAYSTAAGVAGVTWPSEIVVFVSEDGETWHRAGDLVEQHADREPLPTIGEYATQKIWTDDLATHGRFVKMAVFTEGRFIFVDEVQVFRGPEDLSEKPYRAEPIEDVELYVRNQPIYEQHQRDLAEVREDIADLPEDLREDFEDRADELKTAIDRMAPVELEDFRAILPMTDVEERIFQLGAEVWLAQGKDRVRLWHKHRWDHLQPAEEPQSDAAPALSVEMMRNETRADVLNITSANPRPMRVQLRITGLPGGESPDWITVRQVEHVGSRFIPTVASPLPVAERDGASWTIEVPSGMTRQVWFEIDSEGLEPGSWDGSIELRSVAAGRLSVPLRVTVHPLTMPEEKTLSVGGWSYTDGTSRGLTEENVDDLIAHLRLRGVNAPWATSASMPPGTFDEQGNMTAEPDTTRFDEWVANWPDAKISLVFAAVGQQFADAQMGSELFDRQVGQWAEFWTDHMTELGLEADQLGVLLVDEPNSVEEYETITAWAKAIEATAPEMVIWEDPFYIDDHEPMLEMFELADVLCPNRVHYIHAEDSPWREILTDEREQGRELWFYSCSGPARTFGPYSYYLAQAWHAWDIGAQGSNFWAYADLGGASTWNDYIADSSGSYSPIFVDDTSVTAAKPMEAIRESQQDFEYLVMLERLVNDLATRGAEDARLAEARELLERGPDRVIDAQPEDFRWDTPVDRSGQDQVRREILRLLTTPGARN